MVVTMNFSERLVELRKTHNLTQKQLASNVGMSELGIQRYEYGTREPSYKYLIAIAEHFDVSIDYLVGRTNNPKINY